MNNAVRVCLLTSSYPRFEGDIAGIFIRDLCAELAKRDFVFDIVAPADAQSRETPEDPGISVTRFNYMLPRKRQRLAYGGGIEENLRLHPLRALLAPFFMLFFFFATLRACRKCDLIWSHWLMPAGIVGALAARLSGKPHLITVHSRPPNMCAPPLRFLMDDKTRLTTVNRGLSELMRKKLLVAGDVRTIPMGAGGAPARSRNERAELRKRYSLGDKFVILYMGRLVKIKGLDVLINAAARLRNTLLVIAGEGPRGGELAAEAARLGAPVRFLGILSGADKFDWLAACDIFTLPSIVLKGGRTEGTPVSLIEAMLADKPVVASDTGGIRDVITDGYNGLLTPPGDRDALAGRIRLLQNDRGLRNRLAENARTTASRYKIESVAEEYAGLLRECAGGEHNA